MHHLSSRYIPCDGRLTASAYFNPHSPHGERPSVSTGGMILVDFNPRSPSGERQCRKGTRTMNLIISIHAPRLGSDFLLVPLVWNDHRFQSTLPAGERQSSSLLCVVLHYISTHALRMGSDGSLICDFDPGKFQSTPPAWGATGGFPLGFYGVSISIHPPRMGSDNGRCIVLGALAISIHAPRMGSDSTVKAYSNDRIKRSTLREPHFLYSKNACFSPIFSMCATTSRTKNQRIRVSFGSYPGLAPTCFTLDWYRFPRL